MEEVPYPGADERPDHHPGAEDPPRSAGADGQGGGQDLDEGQGEDDPQGQVRVGPGHRLLHEAVAGAESPGDGETEQAHEQASHGGLEDGAAGERRERPITPWKLREYRRPMAPAANPNSAK